MKDAGKQSYEANNEIYSGVGPNARLAVSDVGEDDNNAIGSGMDVSSRESIHDDLCHPESTR